MSDDERIDWPDEPQTPFRWDVRRREQLGSLLDGWTPTIDDAYLAELIRSCARMIAFCGDGDLWFVGRSPDPLFDFLSGAFEGTTWDRRLHQLPVSFRGIVWYEAGAGVRNAFRRYLDRFGLTPRMISSRERPTTLVDMVASGDTFGELVRHWHAWASDDRVPWVELQRKLRLVGLVVRTETSPKTWRWQQHATWTRLLPARSIRNVSTPDWLVYSLASGPKASRSFPPYDWANPRSFVPSRNPEQLEGLRVAVYLYETGRSTSGRQRLADELFASPGIGAPWLRSLAHEVRARPGERTGFMPSSDTTSPDARELARQERLRAWKKLRRAQMRNGRSVATSATTDPPTSHNDPGA